MHCKRSFFDSVFSHAAVTLTLPIVTIRNIQLRLMRWAALQTPTPNPNAYCVPRACASRPVRGPLDAHFRPLRQRAGRSASLPSGLDSCARKPMPAQPRGSNGGACGTPRQQDTPAFAAAGLDPRPGARVWPPAPSDVAPTSADFNILLHKPAPHSSSSDQAAACNTASTARTTRSLTPRLHSLAVSALNTAAGHIDTQIGLRSNSADAFGTVQQPLQRARPFSGADDEQMHHADSIDDAMCGDDSATGLHQSPSNVCSSGSVGSQAGPAAATFLPRSASTPAALDGREALDHAFQATLPSAQPFSPSLKDAPRKVHAQRAHSEVRVATFLEELASADGAAGAAGAVGGEADVQMAQSGEAHAGELQYAASGSARVNKLARPALDAGDMAGPSESGAKRVKRAALAQRNVNALRGGVPVGCQPPPSEQPKGRHHYGLRGSGAAP